MAMSVRTSISKRIRFEVLKRDSFTCVYCGRKAPEVKLHIDHVVPIAKGGTSEIINLVSSCQDCNLGKAAVSLSEKDLDEKVKKQIDTTNETIKVSKRYNKTLEKIAKDREEALDRVIKAFSIAYPREYLSSSLLDTLESLTKTHGPLRVQEMIKVSLEKHNTFQTIDTRIRRLCLYHGKPKPPSYLRKVLTSRGIQVSDGLWELIQGHSLRHNGIDDFLGIAKIADTSEWFAEMVFIIMERRK